MKYLFSKLSSVVLMTASEQITGSVIHLKVETEPRFSELLTSVESDTTNLKRGMNKKRAGEYTEEVDLGFLRFKHDYELLRDSAELKTRETEIEERGRVRSNPAAVAAETVLDSMVLDKAISRYSKSALLGLFTSQKSVLDEPDLQQAISGAELGSKYEKLCTSHSKLNELMQESADLEAAKNQIPSATEAKQALVTSLNNLCRFVDMFAKLGNPDYSDVAEIIEELIIKLIPAVSHKHEQDGNSPEEEICEEDHCSDHDGDENIQNEE